MSKKPLSKRAELQSHVLIQIQGLFFRLRMMETALQMAKAEEDQLDPAWRELTNDLPALVDGMRNAFEDRLAKYTCVFEALKAMKDKPGQN